MNSKQSSPPNERENQMPLAGLRLPSVMKVTLGLLLGLVLLFLVLRYVNLSAVLSVLQNNLATPRGIALAMLAGAAFLLAWIIRALRWKLFLDPIGKVSALKAIELYLIGVFFNFLIPIQGGEVIKCFLLKRGTNIKVSASLPTVAMDKTMDLMPVLLILAIVPLLGITMGAVLWAVLGVVGIIFCSLLVFVALAARKRDAATGLLQKLTDLLPESVANKIEGFAIGFIDSLLILISQPKIFVRATMLTGVAIILEGLWAMLAFWTIGYPIPFWTAAFGYLTYNLYHILPTPPGQIGSEEAVALLVFNGLLHLPALQVTAMVLFAHLWAALLLCSTGLASLSALGVTIRGVTRFQTGENEIGADTLSE